MDEAERDIFDIFDSLNMEIWWFDTQSLRFEEFIVEIPFYDEFSIKI